MDFIELFREYSPRMLSSGEINMQCPFRENHSEDSQHRRQMNVNIDKNTYHCFSCGARGTALSLLTTKFEVPLDVAVSLVVDKFFDEPKIVVENESPNCSTYVPEHPLSFSVPPQEFLDRGFSEELLQELKIGITVVEGNSVISIPLFQDGRLVGVKYRSIGNKEFWYSPGFDKRKFIYHEPPGKKIVVVESESDTMNVLMNGTTWVGAVLGVEVSPFQLKRMTKYERIYSAFDNDEAGFLATEKFYLKARVLDSELLFVPYDADDPGECPKSAWSKGLLGAVDYAEYSYIMSSILGDKYLAIQKKAREMVLKKS